MTGFPLIIAFVIAIIVMIIAISKFKIHPFLAIMTISLILGLVAGIPLMDQTAADGTVTQGLANVIGAGFSGTRSTTPTRRLRMQAFGSSKCTTS